MVLPRPLATETTLEIVRRPNEGNASQWVPEGQTPPPVAVDFTVLPRQWVMERTFGWLGGYRRHSKDNEAGPESRLAWVYIAFVRLLIQRFGELRRSA